MAKIAPELLKAYKQTEFIFFPDNGIEILRVGKNNKLLDKKLKKMNIKSAMFITAWNPHSNNLSSSENKKRQNKLIKYLIKRKLKLIYGFGRSKDFKYHEDSVLVFGIDKKTAKEYGSKFGQNAVVYYEKEERGELLICR